MKRLALCSALLFSLAACKHAPETVADTSEAQATPTAPASSGAFDTVLAGDWREAKNRARDKYRHPRETLEFFGVKPGMTVIEIWPSGGWYTEVLAPYLRDKGKYIGVINDPSLVEPGREKFYAGQNNALRAKLGARPDVYDRVELKPIHPLAPELGEPNSADAVLTFRNVHNWVMGGNEKEMFAAFYEVLKPGGVLGVVDHRAAEGAELEKVRNSGYLPEAYVINLAVRAGFRLEARSEVNANPKDRKDYPNGVWTLPPALREGDKGRDEYLAIGESDRMTLRFVKPNN